MSDFHVVVPGESYVYGVGKDEYGVYLPHSCDEWVITASGDSAEAVSGLEEFVRDAQAAMDELRNRIASGGAE